MSCSPALPRMLQPNQLKQLNEHLVDTTGCFAFLKTDQVLFSLAPQGWQDAYTVFGVGLYAVYHDYGCKFLYSILLSDDFCPDTLPKPSNHRLHVGTLNREIRTNLAHGLLYPSQREGLRRKLCNYYLQGHPVIPGTWPDYINQLTERDWIQITQRLVKDSDNLYDFLWSWGDEWAKNPDNLPTLQEQFVTYRDCFANSFDDRVCRPLLYNYGVRPLDIFQYTKSNGQTAPIDQWRRQLIESYRNGKRHPEELCHELERLIGREFEQPGQSSIDIAAEFGF